MPALVATSVISGSVIMASALNSERFKNELLLQFANEKINQIAKNLEAETLDWAVWNETFDHLLNKNPDYYKKQYNQYSFARTPFVVSLNRNGAVFSSTTWDFKRNQPIPLGVAASRQIEALIPNGDPLAPATFLSRFQGRPFLFSVQPVRSTDSAAPPSGRLLFVRPLDKEDVSFKDSNILNRALGTTHEFYGAPGAPSANPLAPIQVAVPLTRWQGTTPMQLVIERQPRERIEALRTIGLLILASISLMVLLMLRGYAQARRFRLLELNTRRERLRIRRDLETRRNHDDLTGLLSESGFLQATARQQSRYPGFLQAIIQIDLDHFSLINNGLGRRLGDEALKSFARQLRQFSHTTTEIARIGGDEFTLSLIGTSENALRSEVSILSQKLNNLQIDLNAQLLNITVSIGAAIVEDGNHGKAMHEATIASSVVKMGGGHAYQFYGDALGTTDSYLAIQQANQELTTAIHEKRLQLFGQHAWQLNGDPSLPSSYVELLCRISHPTTGEIYWRENIMEAAHFCGSLPLFDQTVIELAFDSLSELLRGPLVHAELVYAINITPDTLVSPTFVQSLDSRVDRHGINPSLICLEITEQAALRNPGEAVTAMKKLRQLGFRMALDDFGTGMTSLGYLRDLPLDYVKIDKSFIRKLKQDKASNLIVQFVVELSKEIGFQTIAEGVEDVEQLHELKALGISIAQGYVVTYPQPFRCDGIGWLFGRSGAQTLNDVDRSLLFTDARP